MKSFKLKKRNYRREIYLSDAPIRPFDKPKFKFCVLFKIHPPSLYKPTSQVVIQSLEG